MSKLFEAGDLVRGKTGTPYGITNADMTEGVVVRASGDDIEVKIRKHKLGATGIYTVSGKYFEKIGHLEIFDRDKFLELLKKSKAKAVEYLRGANLRGANLRDADLRSADLRSANLRDANLRSADLRSADLRSADLRDANLRGADLRGANLRDANLRSASLRGADLSQSKGLLDAINYLEAHFERTDEGYIVYKSFNSQYRAPEGWKIEPGAILEENVNFDRCCTCGCGINVAPLEWAKGDNGNQPYKLLIRFEWLAGVVVPYNTDGKIRCGRAQIIGMVE